MPVPRKVNETTTKRVDKRGKYVGIIQGISFSCPVHYEDDTFSEAFKKEVNSVCEKYLERIEKVQYE